LARSVEPGELALGYTREAAEQRARMNVIFHRAAVLASFVTLGCAGNGGSTGNNPNGFSSNGGFSGVPQSGSGGFPTTPGSGGSTSNGGFPTTPGSGGFPTTSGSGGSFGGSSGSGTSGTIGTGAAPSVGMGGGESQGSGGASVADSGMTETGDSGASPGGPAPCLTDPNQIVMIGDSYVNWITHTFPTDMNNVSGLTIADFAVGGTYEMAFSEASAFCRAFKRWTGSTPNEYRAAHGGRPTSLRH
jgi:hypothetical protein